ncbi:MAG: uncharacterized protein A8A55_0648 [Amphiamblys sp. WSBS2006]|nr:MAG: uncharacterized protein A8A55_0648 [Amphiamblys sp. WSBS2006]
MDVLCSLLDGHLEDGCFSPADAETKESFVRKLSDKPNEQLCGLIEKELKEKTSDLLKTSILLGKRKHNLFRVLLESTPIRRTALKTAPEAESEQAICSLGPFLEKEDTYRQLIEQYPSMTHPNRSAVVFLFSNVEDWGEQAQEEVSLFFNEALREFPEHLPGILQTAGRFPSALLGEMQGTCSCLLEVTDTELLPILCWFLLQTASDERAEETIQQLRSKIDFFEIIEKSKRKKKSSGGQKTSAMLVLHEIRKVFFQRDGISGVWADVLLGASTITPFDISVAVLFFEHEAVAKRKPIERLVSNPLFEKTMESILPDDEWLQRVVFESGFHPQTGAETTKRFLLAVFRHGCYVLRSEIIHRVFLFIKGESSRRTDVCFGVLHEIAQSVPEELLCFFPKLKTLVDFIGSISGKNEEIGVGVFLQLSFHERHETVTNYLVMLGKKWCCHWEECYRRRGVSLLLRMVATMHRKRQRRDTGIETSSLLSYLFRTADSPTLYTELTARAGEILSVEPAAAWIQQNILGKLTESVFVDISKFGAFQRMLREKHGVEAALEAEAADTEYFLDFVSHSLGKDGAFPKILMLSKYVSPRELARLAQRSGRVSIAQRTAHDTDLKASMLSESIDSHCLFANALVKTQLHDSALKAVEDIVSMEKELSSIRHTRQDGREARKAEIEIHSSEVAQKTVQLVGAGCVCKERAQKPDRGRKEELLTRDVFALLEKESLSPDAFCFLLDRYTGQGAGEAKITEAIARVFVESHRDIVQSQAGPYRKARSILKHMAGARPVPGRLVDVFAESVSSMGREEMGFVFEQGIEEEYGQALAVIGELRDVPNTSLFFSTVLELMKPRKSNKKTFLFFLQQKTKQCSEPEKSVLKEISALEKKRRRKKFLFSVYFDLCNFAARECGGHIENRLFFVFSLASGMEALVDMAEKDGPQTYRKGIAATEQFLQTLMGKWFEYFSECIGDSEENVACILEKAHKTATKAQQLCSAMKREAKGVDKTVPKFRRTAELFLSQTRRLFISSGKEGIFSIGAPRGGRKQN